MATFLFDEIIFGPVNSRRLGNSLGINLLPNDCKLCNFNCIYCECGWTKNDTPDKTFHKEEEVISALRQKLTHFKHNNLSIDAITFAGNGEPTMHPDFKSIIEQTINVRDKIYPNAKISVLSNATLVQRQSVFEALSLVDMNILKLDSAIEETVQLINQPLGTFNLQKLVEQLKQFNNLTIQTLFIRGEINEKIIDNTTQEELSGLMQVYKYINPKLIMVYSIHRDTPYENVQKVTEDELKNIADKIIQRGFNVSVSA